MRLLLAPPTALLVLLLGLVPIPIPAAASQPQSHTILPGTVTRVVDGDTIDVKLQSGPIRVRLYGIDAPESKQIGGEESTAYLTSRVLHQKVDLEPFQHDRYDRLIAVVELGDENINEQMVSQGHAWAFRKYLKRSDADYCRAEASARTARRGLWSRPASQVTAPWEFRHRNRLGSFTDYSGETAQHCIAALGHH